MRANFWISVLLVVTSMAGTPWRAYAQAVEDDFEEGGPPREPPFTDDPAIEDLVDKPADLPPVAEPTPPPEPQVVTPPKEIHRPAYHVPKSPVTAEGKKTGSERIHHPLARKGLLEIDKDGSYIYDPIKFKSENYGFSIRGGQISPPPNIVSADALVSYQGMYGTTNPAQLSFDYEWYPFTGFGRLGLTGGVGLFSAKGNGRFVKNAASSNPGDSTAESMEIYTFYGLPLSVGAIYRLQFGDRPWLAPYATAGGSYYALVEKRDDDKPYTFKGSPALYGGGGGLFNISAFDRETAFNLRNEYGIQNIWFSIDYRYIQSLRKDLDVSASLISAGLVMDY